MTNSIKQFIEAIDDIQLEGKGKGDVSAAIKFLQKHLPTETDYHKIMSMLQAELPNISLETAKNAINTVYPAGQVRATAATWFNSMLRKYSAGTKLKALGVIAGIGTAASAFAAGKPQEWASNAWDSITGGGESSTELTDNDKAVLRNAIQTLNEYSDVEGVGELINSLNTLVDN